jgi:hypothetical protein
VGAGAEVGVGDARGSAMFVTVTEDVVVRRLTSDG